MDILSPRPARRLVVESGTVIDLAWPHPGGGYDPEAPQILSPVQVTGRLLIGHTAGLSDPDAPIIMREGDVTGPGGALYAEMRCRACVSKVTIGRLDADTLAVIEHRPGCPELAGLLAVAGVRP